MASARNTKKKNVKRKGTIKTADKRENSVTDEIIIWSLLALCCLLLISNFGFGGKIGDIIASFLSDIFGIVSYIIPFLLFGASAFIVSNKNNPIAYIKVLFMLVITVQVCIFLSMVNSSGGRLGLAFEHKLTPAVGVAGTYILIVLLTIISIVGITGKSILKVFSDGGEKMYDRAKEDVAKKRTQMQDRQRLQESRYGNGVEEKRKSIGRGVSFDTTLKKKNPEVREIKSENPSEPAARRAGESAPKDEYIQGTLPGLVIQRGGEKPEKASPASPVKNEQMELTIDYKAEPSKKYHFPSINLLKKSKNGKGDSDEDLKQTALKLQETLQNFGVQVHVSNISCGPSVTRYELQPEMGVKVSKIVGLADDIKLNLAAADIRIEAPIPGKAAVGIEVPNKENSPVMLRDLIETPEFKGHTSKIAFAAGKDIAGRPVIADIAKMPHLLIAGATGSGKSVCINTLIMSILYKASPEEVRLIMIDPKVVELSVYNGIPHLLIPVVTDPKKAAGALNWAVVEMTKRYKAFAEYGVRDMKGYNDKVRMNQNYSNNAESSEDAETGPEIMPQIVIIVDELADLMMVAPGDVEESICRLAQLARAAGIHLVLATQRPSVNVITGLIKANMPSRIAFSVSSGVDSRTIIDMNGAEKLLGKGDMLFYPSGYQKPARVQGAFVDDKEVQSVVSEIISKNGDASYNKQVEEHMNRPELVMDSIEEGSGGNERDSYFAEAGRLIVEKEKASIGMLQRTFKIGFNRAARIMDQLCEAGVVGGEEGTKPRKILMSMMEFEQYINNNQTGGLS